MLRIISGRFRQKRLYLPDEKITRPTTDRVRESVFNILLHQYNIHFDQITVLDAFAGSGAMGLESLSRGAKHVYFAEHNAKVQIVLQKNINLIAAENQTTLFKIDTLNLGKAPDAVDLIFLDPPYSSDIIERVCVHLYKQNWIKEKTLICIESHSKKIPALIPSLKKQEQRIYGQSGISFWNFDQDQKAASQATMQQN